MSSELFETIFSEFLSSEHRDPQMLEALLSNPIVFYSEPHKLDALICRLKNSQVQATKLLKLHFNIGLLQNPRSPRATLSERSFNRVLDLFFNLRSTLSSDSEQNIVNLFMRALSENQNIPLETFRSIAQTHLNKPETKLPDVFMKTPQGTLVLVENLANTSLRRQMIEKLMNKLSEMTEEDLHFVEDGIHYPISENKKALMTQILEKEANEEEWDPKTSLSILEKLFTELPIDQLLNDQGINILIQMMSNLESTKTKSDYTQILVKKVKIDLSQAKELWKYRPNSLSTQKLIDFHLAFAQNPGLSPETSLWLLNRIKQLRSGKSINWDEEFPSEISDHEGQREKPHLESNPSNSI